METTANLSAPKTAFFQDLWSEFSAATLFLGEIVFASVLFCTLFNRPFAYFEVGIWLFSLGFLSYFGARGFSFFIHKRWILIAANSLWLVLALAIFTRFVIFPDGGMSLWQMFITPFLNLSTQPVLQSQLWQMLFLVVLIRRAFTLAGSNANSWRAVRSFQLGMLVFFFFGFTTTWDNFFSNLAPFLFYLLFAVLSLVTSRLATLSSQPNYRFPGFTRTWFAWVVFLTLALILTGSTLGWLTGVGFVTLTEWVLRIIYGTGVSILVLIFSPLIALIGLLLPWLQKLLTSIVGENIGLEQLEFLQSLNNPNPVNAATFTNTVNQVVTVILVIALLITAVIVILSARRRRLNSQKYSNDEANSESRDRKNRRVLGDRPEGLRARLERARRWLAAARIRRVYQQLMDYCQKLDTPRLPAFTPQEFLPQLIVIFPDHAAEATLLTDVYQRVRYGEVPESAEEITQTMTAWSAIKTRAEALVKERRKRLRKS